MEEEEIWKPITDYVGFYEVSNKGRIKSLERIVKRTDNKFNFIKEKILKPKKSGKGYLAVVLCCPKGKKDFLIHRVVAFHFVENPQNKPDVNHKDGDKTNNNDWNVEWCTKSENSIHAYKNKLNIPPKPLKAGDHPSSKNVFQYSLQGEKLNKYESTSIASNKTGIYQSGISRAAQGVLKQAGGFIWKYKE